MAADTSGDKPQWYGRRHGHKLRPNRQRLMDDLLPTISVALPEQGLIDLSGLFPETTTELCLEIGFGGGEHLSAMARNNIDIGFIGCEPFVNGIASLLADVQEHQIKNVRIFDNDARQMLPLLPDACIKRIFLLFPDPWPKKRHNRRRFVNYDTLRSLARVATDDATFLFASDHMDYVAWTLAEADRHPAWEWTARSPSDWREPPSDWQPTRYEAKARAEGIEPVFLSFRKVP